MAQNEIFTTTIKLNSEEAKNRLEELKKKVDDLKTKRNEALAAADSKAFDGLTKDLKKAESELRVFRLQTMSIQETLDNLDSASIGQVERAMRSLNRQLKNTADPDEFRQLSMQLQNCRDRIAELKAEGEQAAVGVRNLKRGMENLRDVMSNMSGASLLQLREAASYLERDLASQNPQSTTYATTLAQLKAVKERMSEINGEQRELVRTIDRYDQEIRQSNKDILTTRRETELINKTLANLQATPVRDIEYTVKILNEQLRDTKRGTEEWNKLNEQLKRCKSELQGIREESQESTGLLERGANFLNKNWGAITQTIAAVSGVTLTIRKATEEYAKMEEAMADVRKYTGLEMEAIRELNGEFRNMDTRTPREQLNELAGAAGRLGITSKKDIMEFVDGANMINTALGDDLGKGAVDQIGKLAMAFGEDERLGLRGAMLATGSAINELAQNSSANAGYLVDFTARLSGVGKQAGLTQAQIMAFGAVMDENMQRDEMASTALSQLIAKMVTDTGTFAKMAGKNLKDFSSLVKTDMNAALMQFFEAMNRKGGFTELAPLFADMGLDGARATQVMSVLADKIGDVQKHQKLANDAYREGKSVVGEYNQMNSTVQAGLEKARNDFNELTVQLGEKLLPIARYGITTTSLLIRTMLTLTQFITENIGEVVALTVAVGILTVTYNAHNVAAALRIVQMKTENVLTAVGTALNKARVASVTALKIAYFLLTGQVSKATQAFNAMRAAAITNPYTALIAVIMAVGAAVYYAVKAFLAHRKALHDNLIEVRATVAAEKDMNDIRKDTNRSTAEEIARVTRLTNVIRSNAWTVRQRRAAIAELQKIVPDYHASISDEGKLIESNKDKLTEYISELRKAALAQAYMKKLSEIEEDRLNARMKADAKSYNVRAVKAELERGKDTTYKSETGANLSPYSYAPGGEQNLRRVAKLEELATQQKAEADALDELAVQNKRMEKLQAQMQRDGIIDDRTKPAAGTKEEKGGGTGSTKTNKQLEKEEKARKKAEAEALKRKRKAAADAKAETNEELAVLAAQYAEGNKTYLQYLDERLEIQKRGLDRMKGIWGEESNEYKMLLDDEVRYQQQHDESMQKLTEKQIERTRRAQAAQLEAQYYDSGSELYMNDDALNEAVFRNDMEAMQKRLELLKKGSEEWLNLRDEMEQADSDHRMQLEQNHMERLQQYREQAGQMNYERLMEIELQGVESFYGAMVASGKMTQDEYDAIVEHIKMKYAELAATQAESNDVRAKASGALDTAKKLAGAGETASADDAATGIFSISQAVTQQKTVNEQLKQLYGEDYENNREYQEAKRQLDVETMQTVVAGAQAAYSTISTFMSGASAYAQACSDLEVAQITKNYDKQIAAAGNNTKKKEKLEAERDKKIADAKSKANKKAMKVELAQAVASTALAAINAYASAVKIPIAGPTLAPIAAGIALAAGALQIATIKKQHQAEEAGYYEGGFTGGTNYRRRAGVVHEGEFVANHQAVNNASILPALQLIDMAQRNNTVGSLTSADVSRALGGGGGSAAVVAPVVNVTTDNEELRSAISSLNEVIDVLNLQLTEGIRAEVSIDGPNGVYKQLKHFERLRRNA